MCDAQPLRQWPQECVLCWKKRSRMWRTCYAYACNASMSSSKDTGVQTCQCLAALSICPAQVHSRQSFLMLGRFTRSHSAHALPSAAYQVSHPKQSTDPATARRDPCSTNTALQRNPWYGSSPSDHGCGLHILLCVQRNAFATPALAPACSPSGCQAPLSRPHRDLDTSQSPGLAGGWRFETCPTPLSLLNSTQRVQKTPGKP